MTYLQFKTKPYNHQFEELNYSKDFPYRGIFWEPGLGKSAHALVLAAYLYNCQKIQQVLIITRNGVDQQFIEEEIPIHLPLLEGQFIADYWRDSKQKWPVFRKFYNHVGKKLVILAINCESFARDMPTRLCKQFAELRPTLLIVDESQEFSGHNSLRTKNLMSIAPLFPYRRLMTGTPTGGNPVHMFSQMRIMSDTIFPNSIWAFENTYCVKQRGKVWYKDKKTGEAKERMIMPTVGFKNLDKLERVTAPYISRKTKDECLDLPPKIYKTEAFQLSAEERALYNKVKSQTLSEIAPGKFIDADMAVKKLIRLQQIACGFATFEDLVKGQKGTTVLPNPSRMEALEKVCETIRGKCLIWANFTTAIDMIMEMLNKKYGSNVAVRYDGTVTDTQRQANKLRFKGDAAVKFFVGHPAAGGVGLNLDEADDTIYFSNGFNLKDRLQSEDRNHRATTKFPVTYTDLVAVNTVDQKIIKALKNKFDIASQLTGDELKEWIS